MPLRQLDVAISQIGHDEVVTSHVRRCLGDICQGIAAHTNDKAEARKLRQRAGKDGGPPSAGGGIGGGRAENIE